MPAKVSGDGPAVVIQSAIESWSFFNSDTPILANNNEIKGKFCLHARKFARSASDGEDFPAIIPVHVNRGPIAMFVCVAIAIVFIQLEVGVLPAINTDLERIRSLRG